MFLSSSLTHGDSNSFIESACWADDIRDFYMDAMTKWHYIDQPYNYDGLLELDTNPEF